MLIKYCQNLILDDKKYIYYKILHDNNHACLAILFYDEKK